VQTDLAAAATVPRSPATLADTEPPDPYELFQLEEHLGDVRRMRAAFALGVALWCGFGLLDVVAVAVVPELSLSYMLLVRAAPIALLAPALWLMYRSEPPSQRALTWLERAVTTVAAAAAALLAVEFWGLTSPYVTGLGLILVVRAFMRSDPWRRGAVSLGVPFGVHLAILLGGVIARGELATQLADRRGLLVFATSELVNITIFVLVVSLGHRLYALRRRLFEARSIGRYQLRRRIGGGGMGEIWAAYHPALHREVALKIIRPGTVDARRVARFQREVRATTELVHPNTIRIFDFGATDDGLWYYAMELLDGEDLSDLVKRSGPLPPARAVRLVEQAARALAEAHGRLIIHRDIKPDNLFLVEPDTIKVLDFGIAHIAEPDAPRFTTDGHIGGTPGYMAPEVIAGAAGDVAADIYALGATLYFLLVGRAPFTGATHGAIMTAQLESTPVPPSATIPAVSAELDALVLRCLARAPGERYASALELADALGTLLL